MVQLRKYAYGSLKSWPMGLVLNIEPYSGLPVYVPHSETNTSSSGSHWGKKEHTAPMRVPMMTGTEVSHSPGIPASKGNPASHVQDDGNGNMSSVLTG